MSQPPSAPPDEHMVALFRVALQPAVPAFAAWLRSDAPSFECPPDAMNAVHSLKSAARALGIAALAAFVDALERGVVALEQLPHGARTAGFQVLSGALAYLSQLARAQMLPQFVAATAPELGALRQALEALHDARDRYRPELEDDTTDSSLLELFRTEVEQCTKLLSDGVLALDTHGPAGAPWESLMRAAHSIKGAARIVKLPELAQLAHALEECLLVAQAAAQAPTNTGIEALLQAIDTLHSAGKIVCERVPGGRMQVEAAAAAVRLRISALAERKFASVPPVSRAPSSAPPTAGESGASRDAKASAAQSPRLMLVQAQLPAEAVLAQFVKRDTVIAPFPVSQAPAPETVSKASVSMAVPAAKTSLAPKLSQAPKQDRVLRIAADSINRLMGLAGESVVESRRGVAFTRSLAGMKKQHAALIDMIDAFEHAPDAASTHELLRRAKEQARACAGALGEHGAHLDDYLRRASDLGERVYREALRSRMRPFADGTHGFPRLVRDLSHQLAKRARLEIDGESTEVDRDALDSLEAPINHLLRNALDHGVETPAERTAAGKPELALLRIEARHHAGMLSIAVSDDGRGIDADAIRKKAIEKGLVSEALAAGLTRAELFEFLFLPGFTTTRAVSEISGRGVGLDVVKNSVEALGGSVRVSSEPGRGTTFHLHLPVTRSVVRAVVADVDGEAYAFPLLRIDRIDRVPIAQVKTLENREYALIDQQPIALVSARGLFDLAGGGGKSELHVIVISDRIRRYGIVVDALRGEHDLFVRPLDPRLGKVQDIAAAAILLDGTPALIIDVDDLLRSVERRIQSGGVRHAAAAAHIPAPPARKRVLVVDDSIMVREAERQLLESRGYAVDVAVDGVDGWNSIRRGGYDLVITDIDMPRMNGIELVRSIKQDAKLAATPVVIVSYKDREEDRMRGLEAGANYYLSKSSFDDDGLVEAVQDLIGGAAA